MLSQENELLKRFKSIGQGHIFDNWEDRSFDSRKALLESIKNLDLDFLEQTPFLLDSNENISNKNIQPVKITSLSHDEQKKAKGIGAKVIKNGKCALLTVAGGKGTRLGVDEPKGTFPVTPIRRVSLFQLFAEKIVAANSYYETIIPWYIMTSPDNHVETIKYFKKNEYFNIPERDVKFFTQGTNPVLSPDGKIVLSSDGGILCSADGHGGVISAMDQAGIYTQAYNRGIQYLFYFQIENPLVNVPDPLFLGAHLLAEAKISTKVVEKNFPEEKLGIPALVNGLPGIVEYSDCDLSGRKDSKGESLFPYGSIGVHIVDLEFIMRLPAKSLPFHLANKPVEFLISSGKEEVIRTAQMIKFEKFFFDIIPFSDQFLFLEVNRLEEFSPLKNRNGNDSIFTCEKGQIIKAVSWLEKCGIKVLEKSYSGEMVKVEITPAFAIDEDELADKVKNAVTIINENTLLDI